MGLYVQATGEKFDSKVGTVLMVGVIGFVLFLTFFGGSAAVLSSGKSGDIAQLENRKVGKYALQDWEYPPFFDLAHHYVGDGGYSAELRSQFEKFDGQIAHPGTMRARAKTIEQKAWQAYGAHFAKYDTRTLEDRDIYDLIAAVQSATASHPYREDFDDEWFTPVETWERAGDCEDIAFLKYWLLMRLGVPERNIRLVHLDGTDRDSRRDNISHIFVAVIKSTTEWTILDNGAYYSASSPVSKADFNDDEIEIYSTFNRFGNWTHRNFARPPYGVVTPDIVEQCKSRSFRHEHELRSPGSCHGYVLSQSEGNMSPRYTALWGDFGSTAEHFPMGRIGVMAPLRWGSEFEAIDLSRYMPVIHKGAELVLSERQARIDEAAALEQQDDLLMQQLDYVMGLDLLDPVLSQLEPSDGRAELDRCQIAHSFDYCYDQYIAEYQDYDQLHKGIKTVWAWNSRPSAYTCARQSNEVERCAFKFIREMRAWMERNPLSKPYMVSAERRWREYYRLHGFSYDGASEEPEPRETKTTSYRQLTPYYPQSGDSSIFHPL